MSDQRSAAIECLRELQAAVIAALGELDAPKVQISLSYERLVAAIDACDALPRDEAERDA